jgi:DNA-binding response OmpR family regulator
MKILLAEDDLATREAMADLLTREGYAVLAVGDGLAAWQALQGPDAPRLAVLDWGMPGLDGLEVCRRVREMPSLTPPYLILLSGRKDKAEVLVGLEGGADDYVIKPVDLPELFARLKIGRRIVALQTSLADRVRELGDALARVKQLQVLLPICSYCKKIRDDQNYWQQVDHYITAHSEVRFSHGICPDCMESIVKPELARMRPL